MFPKTTSYAFLNYGEIYNDFSTHASREKNLGGRKIETITAKSIDTLHLCKADTFIRLVRGIGLLLVSYDPDNQVPQAFALHRVIKLNKGVYFNFISITPSATIEIHADSNIRAFEKKKISSPWTYKKIKPSTSIQEIFAYYYQVRSDNYHFDGETHSNWELTFIDNGSLKTTIETKEYTLKEYDLIFYAPGQFHNQTTSEDGACSYLTLIFDMQTTKAEQLINKVFHVDRETLKVINQFVSESNKEEHLIHNDLLLCYVNEIVVKLLNHEVGTSHPVAHTPMQQKFESETLNEILMYINENIYSAITIESLCYEFSISRSSLQQLFKNNLNLAPKQYISDLKLKRAKLLIKESKYTISEISNILGFASIHYFSRKFKQHFNITPTAYAKTIYN